MTPMGDGGRVRIRTWDQGKCLVAIFSHTPSDPSIDTRQELQQAMREVIAEMELKGNTDQALRLVGVLAADTYPASILLFLQGVASIYLLIPFDDTCHNSDSGTVLHRFYPA